MPSRNFCDFCDEHIKEEYGCIKVTTPNVFKQAESKNYNMICNDCLNRVKELIKQLSIKEKK